MRLNIYSLKRTIFSGEAKSLNCQTKAGEITILDNHAPLITILSPGMVCVNDTRGEEHYVPIRDGFLEVKPDSTGGGGHVRLIVEE